MNRRWRSDRFDEFISWRSFKLLSDDTCRGLSPTRLLSDFKVMTKTMMTKMMTMRKKKTDRKRGKREERETWPKPAINKSASNNETKQFVTIWRDAQLRWIHEFCSLLPSRLQNPSRSSCPFLYQDDRYRFYDFCIFCATDILKVYLFSLQNNLHGRQIDIR